MDKIILLMDVGGTNTRARILQYNANRLLQYEVVGSRSAVVTGKAAFLEFLSALVTDFNIRTSLAFSVLCCAGPVLRHGSVKMTNWSGSNSLDLSHLEQYGLLRGRTVLLNDMEAAAYRLVAGQDFRATPMTAVTLYHANEPDESGSNNAVLIMPGTGVGVAAIHTGNDPSCRLPLIIPCEVQHSPIPALDDYHAALIKTMAACINRPRPSWEDFISGKGLENIHRILQQQDKPGLPIDSLPDYSAASIAEHAIQDGEPVCRAAMQIYYRCIGALAQVLALIVQPVGGIFLAGTSTFNNHAFIRGSEYVAELQNNAVHHSLLKRFPVYLVMEELNLEGAAYVAHRCLQDDAGFKPSLLA